MQNLKSLSFTDRLSRIGYLLKHTFTVVGRDPDIAKPLIWMGVYATVMVTAFFVGVAGLFLTSGLLATIGFGAAVVLYLYKFFFYNYKEIGQSWLVYETVCGRDRSYGEAKQKARDLKWSVRKLAALDLAMAYLMSKRNQNSNGWGQKLLNLFLAGLNEVWDLVNHYLLPAVAIDNFSLTEGIKQMKQLRSQVPATLTGVFGIDFIGRLVGQINATLYLVLFLLSGGLAYLGSGVLPEAFAFTVPENPVTEVPIVLNALPIVVFFYLGKVMGAIFERVVTSVKVIYFTIFYTQITHADHISDDLQSQLVSFLRMEEDPDAAPAASTEAPVASAR